MRDWSEEAQHHRDIRDASTPPKVHKHAGESSSERYQRHGRNLLAALLIIVALVILLALGAACLFLLY